MSERRRIMLVAGEPSGDALGAALMAALKEMAGGTIEFSGVGGPRMTAEGLTSLFPMSDISVMGVWAVARRLPKVLQRIAETASVAVEARPDLLVIIDSPDFTHRVAKRVARRAPDIPIADYVAPTAWAWRPGRAKAMARYVRRVLAILPFEPKFFAGVGGLDCVYVGHPAIEQVPEPGGGERFRAARGIDRNAPLLLLLPGSREAEVERHLPVFGEAAALLCGRDPALRLVVPAAPHVRDLIETATSGWPVPAVMVEGEDEKRAAFGAATAALAASGTVSLELGLARVPMVVAYRIDPVAGAVGGRLLKIPSVVMVNLILDRPAVREFLQEDCTADALAGAVAPLLQDTGARHAALRDLDELRAVMGVGGEAPSRRAARAVLDMLEAAPVKD